MTTGRRIRLIEFAIGFIMALGVVVVSCTNARTPGAGADDPLAEDLERATAIAVEELDKPWILDLASSRYDLDGDTRILDNHVYVFVSDDGAASYWLVRFHADGTISEGPVAGRSRYRPEAFDFAANGLTSVEAVDIAWDEIGASLVSRCGPVDWIDVTGTRNEEGVQWWRVDHSTVGEVHTVWVNAITGALGDIEQEPC